MVSLTSGFYHVFGKSRYAIFVISIQQGDRTTVPKLAIILSATLCMLGIFSFFFCRLLTFSKLTLKNLLETLSECQTVWIQIRTDVLSVLIWVQTVCKGYQQATRTANILYHLQKILSFVTLLITKEQF